jgi:hypothetical protein
MQEILVYRYEKENKFESSFSDPSIAQREIVDRRSVCCQVYLQAHCTGKIV